MRRAASALPGVPWAAFTSGAVSVHAMPRINQRAISQVGPDPYGSTMNIPAPGSAPEMGQLNTGKGRTAHDAAVALMRARHVALAGSRE